MGIYLNPGNENFKGMLKARIYVDKTMMIDAVNSFIDEENKYICISRPRRFGKTMAGNMLCSYYSKGCDSRELFSKFKIAQTPDFEKKLNKYNVIKIDMNSEYQNTMKRDLLIQRLTKKIIDEMRVVFQAVIFNEDDSLAEAMLKVYSATGQTFILLIDEYDVLVREQVSRELFDEYLSFLN